MNSIKSGHKGVLYPVILPVSEKERHFKGRDKVKALSARAREALAISAEKSELVLPDLPKNADGVPLPVNGIYWSLTHKSDFVGAVVSTDKIGIDIEKIRSFSSGLFKKTASKDEWALSTEDPVRLFFRYWTAKEAVIKTLGSGLKDLLKCEVVQLPDEMHLIVNYNRDVFNIEHFFFSDHIASVVKDSYAVEWSILL